MDIYVKKIYLHISYFLIFDHDFIIYIDFTHNAASSTASDDVTKYLIQTL